MNLHKHLHDPATMMRLGMLFLILGSLSHWLLHPSAAVASSFVDFVTGLLYGISIGCLLLSVSGRRRRRLKTMGGPRA